MYLFVPKEDKHRDSTGCGSHSKLSTDFWRLNTSSKWKSYFKFPGLRKLEGGRKPWYGSETRAHTVKSTNRGGGLWGHETLCRCTRVSQMMCLKDSGATDSQQLPILASLLKSPSYLTINTPPAHVVEHATRQAFTWRRMRLTRVINPDASSMPNTDTFSQPSASGRLLQHVYETQHASTWTLFIWVTVGYCSQGGFKMVLEYHFNQNMCILRRVGDVVCRWTPGVVTGGSISICNNSKFLITTMTINLRAVSKSMSTCYILFISCYKVWLGLVYGRTWFLAPRHCWQTSVSLSNKWIYIADSCRQMIRGFLVGRQTLRGVTEHLYLTTIDKTAD